MGIRSTHHPSFHVVKVCPCELAPVCRLCRHTMLGLPSATWTAFLQAAACWVAFLAAGSTATTTLAATIATKADTPPTPPCAEASRVAKGGSSNPALVKSEAIFPAESLRSTIEESVLNRLATSIREHSEMVERGERRPRPFVTLTYAQSIDGSIAAADKSQVLLSGSESRTMTHGLRSIHDAILVGAGTVRQDNPRLNIRHWPPGNPPVSPAGNSGMIRTNHKSDVQEGTHAADRPRAVILAGNLSSLPRGMRLDGAVIFTDLSSCAAWRWLAEWGSRSREGSKDHAATDFLVVHCRLRADGRCDLGDCLDKLYSMGFRSLMVEGGATVISSFLRGCDEGERGTSDGRSEDRQLVDRVVITIAPVFVQGYNALATAASACGAPATHTSGFPLPLLDVGYVRLGQDLIVVGAPARATTPCEEVPNDQSVECGVQAGPCFGVRARD